LLISYKFNRAGENDVYRAGLLILMHYNKMKKRNYRFRTALI